MNLLRAQLFQSFQVATVDGRLLDLGSPTTRSLFAYLLLHRGRPIDRRHLAFFFWPEADEASARRNLRQYLHRLRRALQAAGEPLRILLVEEPALQLVAGDQIWVDVEAFRAGCNHGADLAQMVAASDLYTGELLPEIYEDWCEQERNTLHQMYIQLLDRLSQAMQSLGQMEQAAGYAQKWVLAEPLDESAHRRLMTVFALAGDRHRALQQYQVLQALLERELDSPPLPETQALAKSIQSGAFQQEPILPAPRQRPLARPDSHIDIQMVGRQAELAILQEVFLRAQTGQGKFILVTGESGIGKTRLVQEYMAQHPGLAVLQATCHELDAAVPYAPVRQLFADAGRLMPAELLAAPPLWLLGLANFFPALLGSGRIRQPLTSPGAATPLLGEPLNHLVLSMAAAQPADKPLHLILDDLQWADGLTWDFLSYLARQASRLPLVVIGLCRLEDLARERNRILRTLERSDLAYHIPLKRLTMEQAAELSRQLLPAERVDALLMSRLYRESEGIPFFVIEMARALRENDPEASPVTATGYDSKVSFPLPPSIQRVIEARLDRLSQPGQALLAVAAAIGRAFTFQLLVEASQVSAEDAVPLIEEWLQRGLVLEVSFQQSDSTLDSPHHRYDFGHDKIRQVAYASLSQARRQVVHRCIAEAFELYVTEPATLAYHFARSDQPLRALPYLTKAGEQALQVRSYQEARQFGLRAVSLLSRMPGPRERAERVDLNLQLVQAYAFSGDLSRALEILEETERLADGLGNIERQVRVYHRAAQLFWLSGQPQVAGDYARRTLHAADELHHSQLQQAALRMLGRVGIALSMYDDAIVYLNRYANWENHGQQPPDLAVVMGYLGVAYARVGAWNRALQFARQGLELAEKDGSSQVISFARMQLGFVYADLRYWPQCLDIIQMIPDPLEGALAGARDALTLAVDVNNPQSSRIDAEQLQLTPTGFMHLGLLGRVLANLGEPMRGVQTILPALAWAEKTKYRVFHYLPRLFLSECLLLGQQLPRAAFEAEQVIEQARQAGNRWAVGMGLRALAECMSRLPQPNWPLVEDHLIESMELFRQVRARPDLARTYLALRRLYDRAGQIAWAVDCHFRAVTIYEELGMQDDLRQAQGVAALSKPGARHQVGVISTAQLRGPNANAV